MAPPRTILVTRPAPEAEATAALLAARGWTPLLAPMLRIRPLAADLPEDIAAIALTSGNAVPALPARLQGVPVFAVGDATAARARAAGFTDIRSAGADAAALADLIVAEAPAGTLLLAVGEGRGERLEQSLAARGRAVIRRAVYAADPATALPPTAADALRAGRVAAALFFSAETVRVFVRLAREAGLAESVSGVSAFAIGGPAVVALQALPWREIRQASHPTQEAMLALLPITDLPPPEPPSEPPPGASPGTGAETSAGTGAETSAGTGAETSAGTGAETSAGTGAALPHEPIAAAPNARPAPIEPAPPSHPAVAPPSGPAPAPTPLPAPSGSFTHRLGPVLIVLGFLLLAGGFVYLWQRPVPAGGAASGTIAALQDRIGGLNRRLARLEARPAAPAAIPPALAARIDALSAQTTALAHQTQVLAAQLPALGQHLAGADDRLHALTAAQSAADKATEAALAGLRQGLAGQEAAQTALAGQLAVLTARSGVTARLAVVQAARTALAAGRPLGAMPDAPPALARFATTAPPTEAALRLSFPAAARAALAASEPATHDKPFWDALLARAESLVTVRQGTRVILGNPAAGPLGAAEARLGAGDLAGAVTALGALEGKAAAAMAPWRDQAAALVAARAALDSMAASSPTAPGPTAPAPTAPAGTTPAGTTPAGAHGPAAAKDRAG